ncbi:MAG: protoporphyrinogen oxidase [Acidimicrobiaceae bacterium]|nr:protoporphyrinogen oxidase [Acidimicrobiaceae bacterium]
MKVVVVGGGIAGLGAAYELSLNPTNEVVLIESEGRLGGKILTETRDGKILEGGADAFLRRNPHGMKLAQELGISDQLTAPSAGSALLYSNGVLHPMPRELAMGIPTNPRVPLHTHSVGLGSRLRASAGILLGLKGDQETDSLGLLCQRRLGRGFTEGVVDPLIGGINAGSVYGSSISIMAPQLLEPLTARPKLPSRGRGQRMDGSNSKPSPIFASLPGGLAQLVTATAERAQTNGSEIVMGAKVSAIEPKGDGWLVHFERAGKTELIEADGVVLATPSYHAADLLRPIAKGAALKLSQIRYSSVAICSLALKDADYHLDHKISGVLIPKGQGFLTTAISISSSKWPSWASPDELLIRVSVGRFGDYRHLGIDDSDLVDLVGNEASSILGLKDSTELGHTKVFRWHNALAQFRPHHKELIEAVLLEISNAGLQNITLAGSYLSGSGVPSSLGSGRKAAAEIQLANKK